MTKLKAEILSIETIEKIARLEKENKELKKDRIKAIEILKAMKHCELLLGGKRKTNIDKLLEILKEEVAIKLEGNSNE